MKKLINLSFLFLITAALIAIVSCVQNEGITDELTSQPEVKAFVIPDGDIHEGPTFEFPCYRNCGGESTTCDCTAFENCQYSVVVNGIDEEFDLTLVIEKETTNPLDACYSITEDVNQSFTFDTEVLSPIEESEFAGVGYRIRLVPNSQPNQIDHVSFKISGPTNSNTCGSNGISKTFLLDLDGNTSIPHTASFCLQSRIISELPTEN